MKERKVGQKMLENSPPLNEAVLLIRTIMVQSPVQAYPYITACPLIIADQLF